MLKTTLVVLLTTMLVAACTPAVQYIEVTATPLPVTATPTAPAPTPTPQREVVIEEGDPLVFIGTLIDGTGADPLPDAALVIQGESITAVGPRDEVAIPPGAQVIEVPGTTILPGFINTHAHNAYSRWTLRTWAQAGVTTVRDVGARVDEAYFLLRDRYNAEAQYARVISAGPLVTVPGGYPIAGNNFPSLTVSSPEDAVRKINDLIDRGAEVIKITITIDGPPTLSLEEATTIVQTAHERGIPVTVHATTARDIERAVDAGVDDIAHASMDTVPAGLIQRMVEMDIAWVPTFEVVDGLGTESIRRFVAAGGRVALGDDAGYLLDPGMPTYEFYWMERAGMSPMEIIVASTLTAAQVCHRDDILGTLEVGKIADVLVVEGDPLQDMEVLTNVRLVIHNGVVIRSEGIEISDRGDTIAFVSDRSGSWEVYVIDTAGGNVQLLTGDQAASIYAENVYPVISPDSTRTIFSDNRDGDLEIYVMNLDGSGEQQLTDNDVDDEAPSWSPDGTRITFTSMRDGNWEIYVMDADGSNPQRLTDNPATDRDPIWRP